MEMTRALMAFDALGQPTRLAVFRLAVQEGQGLAAGEIARRLDLRANTLSSHLAVLVQAGLLSAQRDGRVIRYSANLQGIRALITWLLQDCCGGRPEICAPVIEALRCAC